MKKIWGNFFLKSLSSVKHEKLKEHNANVASQVIII